MDTKVDELSTASSAVVQGEEDAQEVVLVRMAEMLGATQIICSRAVNDHRCCSLSDLSSQRTAQTSHFIYCIS